MTRFEQMLMDKGYMKFILNCKSMKYEHTERHELSSMGNLDHRYIHKSDTVILDKIAKGIAVGDNGITLEDQKAVIVFGLHEYKKPATLISPRPVIKVKRKIIAYGVEKVVIQRESRDDSMIIALDNEDHELIFKSMYDNSIKFYYDLTDGEELTEPNVEYF